MHAPRLLLLALGLAAAHASDGDEQFICIEYDGSPHGVYDPIAAWNSQLGGYVWHGCDCNMYATGQRLRCGDESAVMGEPPGYDYAAYNQIQGADLESQRRRLQFMATCRLTVNVPKRAGGTWSFEQNGSPTPHAGLCQESDVTDCSGKFDEATAPPCEHSSSSVACSRGDPIQIHSQWDAPACRKSNFAYKQEVHAVLTSQPDVDGVGPVLAISQACAAMMEGSEIRCDDGLPVIDPAAPPIYGALAYNSTTGQETLRNLLPAGRSCIGDLDAELDLSERLPCDSNVVDDSGSGGADQSPIDRRRLDSQTSRASTLGTWHAADELGNGGSGDDGLAIGLGVGLGGAALVAGAVALCLCVRRRKQKQAA